MRLLAPLFPILPRQMDSVTDGTHTRFEIWHRVIIGIVDFRRSLVPVADGFRA